MKTKPTLDERMICQQDPHAVACLIMLEERYPERFADRKDHEILDQIRCVAPSIADVKDGFWVKEVESANPYADQYEYTQGSDGELWIPPAALKFIEKLGRTHATR